MTDLAQRIEKGQRKIDEEAAEEAEKKSKLEQSEKKAKLLSEISKEGSLGLTAQVTDEYKDVLSDSEESGALTTPSEDAEPPEGEG